MGEIMFLPTDQKVYIDFFVKTSELNHTFLVLLVQGLLRVMHVELLGQLPPHWEEEDLVVRLVGLGG